MILIASAAYADQDISVEVGLLPPSFLPIGNKRLFTYQIEFLKNLGEDIYLSIPESFGIESFDQAWLDSRSVMVIRVPDGLSLGSSIMYCWNATGEHYQNLQIILGDTLFVNTQFSEKNDYLTLHPNNGYYWRAKPVFDGNLAKSFEQKWVDDKSLVVSGFFSFSNPQYLINSIIEAKSSFIDGVNVYTKNTPLSINTMGVWLDFGHLNSFFHSRTFITTQRAFNDLNVSSRVVTKKSLDMVKMEAEANWFKTLPNRLKIYLPPLLENYKTSEEYGKYQIEYLYLLPLNDLYVFGKQSLGFWKQVFLSAKQILLEFKDYKQPDLDLCVYDDMYLTKTLERLESFKDCIEFDKYLDMTQMAQASAKYICKTTPEHIGVMHGDFCFSNILNDSRTQSLKLIDPRGIDANRNPM